MCNANHWAAATPWGREQYGIQCHIAVSEVLLEQFAANCHKIWTTWISTISRHFQESVSRFLEKFGVKIIIPIIVKILNLIPMKKISCKHNSRKSLSGCRGRRETPCSCSWRSPSLSTSSSSWRWLPSLWRKSFSSSPSISSLWCFNHSPVTQFSVKPQGRPAAVELVEVLVDRVNQPLIQPSDTSGWKNKSGWVNQQPRQHTRI